MHSYGHHHIKKRVFGAVSNECRRLLPVHPKKNLFASQNRKTIHDIEIIKADIEFIKNSVKKKIDIDEFAALERRVLILEKHR